MQLVVAFLSTIIVCGLLIFGARTIVMTYFGDDVDSSVSGNITTTLTNSITDSEKAFQESVIVSPGETGDDTTEGNIAESSSEDD